VTGINHFVSSSDFMGFERNPLKLYRELDNPVLLLDTIFYRKSLEVTGRELDKPKLLLDTIFYRKSPAYQGTQAGSK
jgi:hypothetical protein